jgi:hypothetical protein
MFMKLLSSFMLAGILAFSTVACAKEEPKAAAPVAVAPAPVATLPPVTVTAEKEGPKTKEVCKDVIGKDGKPVMGKDGKAKQTCKTIKIHKKAEKVTTGNPNDPVKKK